jgi:micrococcal nuclease
LNTQRLGNLSKQKRFKLPIGCLIAAGVLATVCGITIPISALSGLFAPAPEPTLDINAINTFAFQTALAQNLETQSAASSPTLEPTSTSLPIATETQAPLPTVTDAVIPVTGGACIPGNPPQTGRVVDVVDGDTIKVLLDADGKTYSVRYIGMDTPENTSQVEYFGPEATFKNSELVYGKTVTLIKDVSETDRYNRLLRYVIADGLFVNYELVAQGYANTASYPPDVVCISTFQTAEQQASVLKLGLWGAPPTQVILLPLPTAPSGGSGGNAPCNCSGPDLDCGDFGTHAAAQSCYNYCMSQGFGDNFRLDGNDNDGLACESLP